MAQITVKQFALDCWLAGVEVDQCILTARNRIYPEEGPSFIRSAAMLICDVYLEHRTHDILIEHDRRK